ncbi:MAG: 4Fe-4S binding protein [Spirochaetales bacterium]|nr:4Fe-4S binding protein [Spirochaetales bacterium]
MKRMTRILVFSAMLIILFSALSSVAAEDRFPRPEFQSEYELPSTTAPSPQDNLFSYIDTAVLIILLILTSYFALKMRTRTGIFICSLFSLIYFGFWKKGCICSIGSIQNIALALFSNTYVIPVFVALFFALPILFSLFFGRVYCAGVCPFGALQDLVAIKPLTLPRWVENTLGIFPALYLGLSVLFAATGSGFIICRFDPFVGLFRFGATFEMFITGGIILLIGVFIARPYCRFICPYGVLLKWASALSRWHVTITPDECIQCKLCENTCPVGAIRAPSPALEVEKREVGVKRLVILFLILPFVMAGTGLFFSTISHVFAQLHPQVQLTAQVLKEDRNITRTTTDASDAFRATGISLDTLLNQTDHILSQFHLGAGLFGLYTGLIIILAIVKTSVLRKRTGYEPDREACVSCGRCFEVCPKEQVRRKKGKEHG